MARFTAPADTGGITLSTGFYAAREGVVEVPDDLYEGDRLGLAANGFVPAPPATAPQARASETVAKSSAPAPEAE